MLNRDQQADLDRFEALMQVDPRAAGLEVIAELLMRGARSLPIGLPQKEKVLGAAIDTFVEEFGFTQEEVKTAFEAAARGLA